MITLKFKDLKFKEEKHMVKAVFLRHFSFYIDPEDIIRIGEYKVNRNEIIFDCNQKRAQKFYSLVDRGLNDLKNSITGKKAVYVHKDSKIPLLGSGSFGIVDRGTNIIEVKPICGCNLDCVYCSIDENKRSVDFVVEKDYLIEELNKIVNIKENDVEIHIGCQGEPLLYAPLSELVCDMSRNLKIKRISMDTNALLLTEKIVDGLIAAGLTRFNLSINTLDKTLSQRMAGGKYSINHVKKIAEYISKKPVKLTLAPVLVKGFNEESMGDIIFWGKTINADFGIQNFLRYSFGKKPAKEIPMKEFYDILGDLQKRFGVKLILSAADYDIVPDKTIGKAFRKGERIKAEIVSCGRFPGESLAASDNRCITLYNCNNKTSKIRIKITKTKHGIYSGICL